ncbi:MAG TPA: MBL fold metallo-hydrolase [Coriobacteriia bacterium]
MRVTVLGSSASYPGPGRACAGHYVEAAGARVLFDCGNGTIANLARFEDPTRLDAVFITHNHPDHYADIYALLAGLRYAPQGPCGPIPLYLPEGLWERLLCLLSERGATDFAEAFVPTTMASGQGVAVGGLTVTPVAVEHTDPTFAMVAEADGARLAYTSDTAVCGGVTEAAKGADLLLAEATLPEGYAGIAPHMTATQAGTLAREAGSKGLALVHVWPTNDRALMARLATEAFGATVVVADEFDVFEISTPGRKDD